jgi:hypothetical protein
MFYNTASLEQNIWEVSYKAQVQMLKCARLKSMFDYFVPKTKPKYYEHLKKGAH